MQMLVACSHLFAIVLVVMDGLVPFTKLLSPLSGLNCHVVKDSWAYSPSYWARLMLGQEVKHVNANQVVEVTRHILLGEPDVVT